MTEASGYLGGILMALMARREPPHLEDPTPWLDVPSDPHRFPAAFLIALCGDEHPRVGDATAVLAEPGKVPAYFRKEREHVLEEVETAADDATFVDALLSAATVSEDTETEEAVERLWAVTFPEGVGVLDDWQGAIDQVHRRRQIEITALNPHPITDPLSEVLFTSNVLVTPGSAGGAPAFWYDHPIPINANPGETELAHGLAELDAAVGFERSRNPEWQGPLRVALSISATHEPPPQGLLSFVTRAVGSLDHLRNLQLYCFDEGLARRLWDEVIGEVPGDNMSSAASPSVFGVSGEYGRHYSFLKALAPLWAVCIDGTVRATFKFDLDQSFPQAELVAESGQSAFEHLTTDRWGAQARTRNGDQVDLMMIAGGLVNEEDIGHSIFTPDVKRKLPRSAEESIFFSPLTQAVSTEGEIVTRYDRSAPHVAQERIHVTGGTVGALVCGLRRWRLFTPSMFGRAEDQAYLLSALGEGGQRPGYAHEPGLIMRHDKADLIPDLIADSAPGKHIGDLVRIRLFSEYGSKRKTLLDPFTGAFVSKIPVTVTSLRFAIHALNMGENVADYLAQGVKRLEGAAAAVASLPAAIAQERDQWCRYYDALDRLEAGLLSGEPWALRAQAAAHAIVNAAAVSPIARPGT